MESREQSLRHIVARAVSELSPKGRRTLLISLSAAVFTVVVVLLDVMTATTGEELYRLVALVCGMAGITLLALAHVLHSAALRGDPSCARMGFFRWEARVFHQVLLVLPVAGLAAGILLALAVGLYVPSVAAQPLFAVAALMFASYLFLAARLVGQTTRFLYRHAREQAEAAARARAEAAEAQLAALQAQMNPHFLFNALNTVASLVRTDGRAAEATVENLADVLRRTLVRSRDGCGTVGEEVDYLVAYLAVEQERWGDRLSVEWAVDPATRDLALPPMTLQPLVENALKHGLGARLEGGTLRISAARANGVLRLAVEDDGVGFAPRGKEGTGLGNLRQRLTTLYGDRASVRVEPLAAGSRVLIELPVEDGAGADASPDR